MEFGSFRSLLPFATKLIVLGYEEYSYTVRSHCPMITTLQISKRQNRALNAPIKFEKNVVVVIEAVMTKKQ